MGTAHRTYERTHPWINFKLDLARADYHLWMDLGAIQSKIEHVANSLLPPEKAQELLTLYLAKGVHATTAIEGNTLSEEQVRQRIERKASLPESKAYLGKEIDNIVQACNVVADEVLYGVDARLTPERIKLFNQMVLEGLALAPEVVPGEFRKHSVGVANYRGAPHEDCEYLVARMCAWLNDEIIAPHADLSIAFAVLRAIMAHLYIAWIHPFGDGNGRTARLVEFQILLGGRAPSIAAHLLSNFYNQTRSEYYRKLAAASQAKNGAHDFLYYAVRGLRDALDDQIGQIRMYQWDVAWRDYVYRKFSGQKGEAAERRRLLALELAKAKNYSASILTLRRLTPEIAEFYANKTMKTLSRDINALQEMQLIRRHGKEFQVNSAILMELLPMRRAEADIAPERAP